MKIELIRTAYPKKVDYDAISKDDELAFESIATAIKNGDTVYTVKNKTQGTEFKVNLDFSARQRDMLLAGGLLNYTKENA